MYLYNVVLEHMCHCAVDAWNANVCPVTVSVCVQLTMFCASFYCILHVYMRILAGTHPPPPPPPPYRQGYLHWHFLSQGLASDFHDPCCYLVQTEVIRRDSQSKDEI